MEFKVGDRVRVIDNAEEYFGLVGTIEKTFMDFMDTIYYEVDIGKELPYAFWGNQLEIYVEEEDFIALDNKNQQGRVLTKEQFKLEELEQRIEKLEKCVMGEQNSLEKRENVSSMSKNGLLTKDERVILRNIPKKYNWIVRDKDGDLYVFEERPKQDCFHHWCSRDLLDGDYFGLFFNSMFMSITQNEPYNIEELLKGECGNEN